MDEIKDQLNEEIKRELSDLSGTDFGSDEYKAGVDGTVKLIDRAIELQKLEMESESKAESQVFEKEFKIQQSKRDEVFKWVEIGIAVIGIAVPTYVKIWGTNKTLKFEETGTVTTMAGKSHITSLFSKK